MLHCLIVEDHPLVAQALVDLVEDHFPEHTIARANTIEQMIQISRTAVFDIILMDLVLDNTFSLGSFDLLKVAQPNTKILVVSSHDDRVYAKRAFELGAHGYVNKRSPAAEIATAMKAVLSGSVFFQNDALKANTSASQQFGSNPFSALTAREFEIAVLMVKGLSNNEIANALSVGKSTVSTHKNAIYEKLNVKNAFELRELGLLYHVL